LPRRIDGAPPAVTPPNESIEPKKSSFRAGFVAIVGRPNAGKSTLLNNLVGQKIAIVTSKPQTTRNRIQGIVTQKGGQIVFIDTPGLHAPDSALGRQMMHEVAAAVEGIDVLLLIVDASRVSPQTDSMLLEKAQRFPGKTILALNKVDAVPKPKLLPLIERFRKEFDFAAIVPLSALKGTGCNELLGEIFREKAIRALHHELPYALAVFVEKFEETPKLVRIEATLNVERDTQKKILIGHKGAMLKKIGTEARKELESLLGAKVFLGLFVKVAQDWRENPQRVRELDWHFQLEGLSAVQAHEPEDEEEGTAE